MSNPTARIAALYRYPVKGLTPEPLDRVRLAPGETFPNDRAYAIENGPSGFDPTAPRHLPKANFLMLMRNQRLASLDARFDDATTTLTLRRDGHVVAEGNLETASGRRAIEAFFDGFAADELRGPAKVLHVPGFSFSDVAAKVVSLINLESVRDLGARLGTEVDPLRFRGNIYVEGLPAWSELDLEGKCIRAGEVLLEGVGSIARCAATNVNPRTAERDLAIPRTLLEFYGHGDCGAYLRVVKGGELQIGAEIDFELGRQPSSARARS
ncbi:MAG TPA: MOSC domain-containing protein [Bauldia sp.]|nr:MOSC domain-containing protein [Bauldia sp.]